MKSTHRLALAIILTAVSTPVITATDGLASSKSTEFTDIRVMKGEAVRISNATDVTLEIAKVAHTPQTMDSCIYSTSGNGNVKAQSMNSDGAHFGLSNGATTPSFIHYTLEWDDTV